MKQLLLICSLVGILWSCSSSGPTYNREEMEPLKGTWVVDNVKYSQSGIRVKAFGVADAQCFKGSVWTLVSNNHTGNMEAGIGGSSDCPDISTNFTWYIDSNDTFYLKPVAQGEKAKNVTSGYEFKVNETSDTTFTLVQSANLDGTPVYISYNFVKQ